MSSIVVNIFKAEAIYGVRGDALLEPTESYDSEVISSGASSVASSISVPSDAVKNEYMFSICNTGTGAIMVEFGATPTALATAGKCVASGETKLFLASSPSLKVAVIDL